MRNFTTATTNKLNTKLSAGSSTLKPWYGAIKASWLSTLKIDRTQITAIHALRCAVGFGLPLSIGIVSGNTVVGVSLAGGAAALAGVGLNYTYRARVRVMLVACGVIALSAFVGNVTSPVPWLSILAAGVWGLIAGMLVAFGQSGLPIGLQMCIALIILTHFGLEPGDAFLQALLMFAGALFQTLLAVIPWPWRQTAPERAALVTVYRQLAAYIRSEYPQDRPPVRSALLKANSVLADLSPHSVSARIFYAVLEEAERIRLNLVVLVQLRQSLPASPELVAQLEQMAELIAVQLEQIAYELRVTSRFISPARPSAHLKELLNSLRQPGFAEQSTAYLLVAHVETLRSQLHTAKKLARVWKYPRQRAKLELPPQPPAATPFSLSEVWQTLSTNLTFRSTIFRHAIRLAAALALATAFYRLLPISIEWGYWIPLTVLLVLRQDFRTTFTRGAARLAGTLLGAILGGLLTAVLPDSALLLAILATLMSYLAFACLFASYTLFSTFLTMETVFLLTLVIPQPVETAEYRALDTVIGGLMALLIFIIWPTWERAGVTNQLATCLAATRNYLVAVLEAYAQPEAYVPAKVQQLRQESRLAYTNALASVERFVQEPARSATDPQYAQEVLDLRDTLAQNTLLLEAYLQANLPQHPLPAMTEFAEKATTVFDQLITALQEQKPLAGVTEVHKAYQNLKQAVRSETGLETTVPRLLPETRSIAQNLDTMQQVLARSFNV